MESFVAYHGVNAATHQQRFDELLAQGMRLTWINVSGDPSDARYAAVWVASDARAWAGLHNLDAAGYQQRFNELTASGLTPSVVSAAGPVDRAVFAALFEQRDVGVWTARHGLTWGESGQPDTMVGQSELAYAAGQVPRCLAVYGDANNRRFAGIWWEGRDGISASWWLGAAPDVQSDARERAAIRRADGDGTQTERQTAFILSPGFRGGWNIGEQQITRRCRRAGNVGRRRHRDRPHPLSVVRAAVQEKQALG